MDVFDDEVLVDAIQPIYQLAWAEVAESHGESFSGCELTEVCPEGPPEQLLPIAREWLARLEASFGLLKPRFKALGIDWDQEGDALYYCFMTLLGHGVGWHDYCRENDIEEPEDMQDWPLDMDCDVEEIALDEYLKANPECSHCGHTMGNAYVPETSDDEAWAELASDHEPDCRWLITRGRPDCHWLP